MKRRAFQREWSAADRRQKLAAIHVCKQQLGMDDDVYRDLIARVSGQHGKPVRSAKDLTFRQAVMVLKELRDKGAVAKPVPTKRGSTQPGQFPGRPTEGPNELAKVEALLADMGLPWSYANGIVKRMYGIDRLEWLETGEQWRGLITALDKEAKRREKKARADALAKDEASE